MKAKMLFEVVVDYFFRTGETNTNCIFMLHYKFTVILYFFVVIYLSTLSVFEKDVYCTYSHSHQLPHQTYENYCLASAQQVIIGHRNFKMTPIFITEIPFKDDTTIDDRHILEYQMIYQFFPIISCLLGAIYLVPYLFWRSFDSGKVCQLAKILNSIDENLENKTERRYLENKRFLLELAKSNFMKMRGKLKYLPNRMLFCEVLNTVIDLIEIYIGYKITSIQSLKHTNIGSSFAKIFRTFDFSRVQNPYDNKEDENFDQKDNDPFAYAFPKIVICVVKLFGPAGFLENTHGICFLPKNITYEYIFVVLWFWGCFLFVCSMVGIVSRLLMIGCSGCGKFYFWAYQARECDPKKMRVVLTNIDYGDFFLLYQLYPHVSSANYCEYIELLAFELDLKIE